MAIMTGRRGDEVILDPSTVDRETRPAESLLGRNMEVEDFSSLPLNPPIMKKDNLVPLPESQDSKLFSTQV